DVWYSDLAGEGQIKEFIGTGPYRFVEHKPDRHIKLARFNEYSARSDAPDGGYGGKRVAYFDEILFIPVPDEAVRLAGVETGEYHYAQSIKSDQHDRGKSLPALEPQDAQPYGGTTDGPPSLPPRAGHGAHHGPRHREQGLLSPGRRALLSRAGRLPQPGGRELQP